ncbi:molybdopterin dinucleotide binding domain-containing protein [Cupriavidus basilensis]
MERKYAGRPRDRAFNTPTGLVELYAEQLLHHGYPPLPRPDQSPTDAEDAGRRLPVRADPRPRAATTVTASTRGLPSLRRRALQPEAEIPAALAAARGIVSGDAIRVSTAVGSARFIAIRSGKACIRAWWSASYGWWQRCDAPAQPALAALGTGQQQLQRPDRR